MAFFNKNKMTGKDRKVTIDEKEIKQELKRQKKLAKKDAKIFGNSNENAVKDFDSLLADVNKESSNINQFVARNNDIKDLKATFEENDWMDNTESSISRRNRK